MRTEKKSSIKNSATRLILIGLLVLIQTGWMIFLMMKLNTYSTAITLLLTFIAMFIAINVRSNVMAVEYVFNCHNIASYIYSNVYCPYNIWNTR